MDAVPLRLRKPQWSTLIASFVIAACIVALFVAVNIAVTGEEGQQLPEAIESIDPVKGATQVPAQTSVTVDLLAGYEGVLVVDGLELPVVNRDEYAEQAAAGQQLSLPPVTLFEPGNAVLTFTPSPNADITEFTQGQHVVQVIYWKAVDGRSKARSFTWTFEVF
ncbi:MAG TPA: hypothetical protein DCR14_07545 [Acidimicrobiaceae bacterium]|nr:hypothetical protein [Acidimicrobiaceae bacterium]